MTKRRSVPAIIRYALKDENINAELTTTQRNEIHRYQYPAGKDAEIILDMDHLRQIRAVRRRIINSQIRILNDHAVEEGSYHHRMGETAQDLFLIWSFPVPFLTSGR